MTQGSLSIGLVAAQAGCTVPTIRYYEEIGLLPQAPRTDGGRRHPRSQCTHRLGGRELTRILADATFRALPQGRQLRRVLDQVNRISARLGEASWDASRHGHAQAGVRPGLQTTTSPTCSRPPRSTRAVTPP